MIAVDAALRGGGPSASPVGFFSVTAGQAVAAWAVVEEFFSASRGMACKAAVRRLRQR
jgi:hypothetical protein